MHKLYTSLGLILLLAVVASIVNLSFFRLSEVETKADRLNEEMGAGFDEISDGLDRIKEGNYLIMCKLGILEEYLGSLSEPK